MKKTLTDSQIKALAYAITHKCYVSDTKAGVSQATLKSLASQGLLVFYAKLAYQHGEIPRIQYRLTDEGFKLAKIGRMLRPLAK